MGKPWLRDVELSLARELNELAIAGYLDGLRDAGWKGDPRLARFGYLAASILRYSLFPMPIGFATLDGERLSQAERAFGQTAEEYVDGWIERQRISATLVDEALRLLPLVG